MRYIVALKSVRDNRGYFYVPVSEVNGGPGAEDAGCASPPIREFRSIVAVAQSAVGCLEFFVVLYACNYQCVSVGLNSNVWFQYG